MKKNESLTLKIKRNRIRIAASVSTGSGGSSVCELSEPLTNGPICKKPGSL
jgi:hypothetical protein